MSGEFEDIIESNPKVTRWFRSTFGRAAFVILGFVIALATALVLIEQHAHEEASRKTFYGYVRSSPPPDLAAMALLLCPSRDCDFSSLATQLKGSFSSIIPDVTSVVGFAMTSSSPDRSLAAFAIQGYTKSGVTVLCVGQRLIPQGAPPLPILHNPQDGISLVTSTATADRGLWRFTSQLIGGSYDSLPLKSARLWLARSPIPDGD